MKSLIFIVVTSLFLFAQASLAQTKICSQLTSVCSSFQSDRSLNSKEEGRFALYLEGSDEEIKLIKVDLWMQMGGHGHGSSPLSVKQVAPGHFDITKAYFVMKGAWQIRVRYQLNDTIETLILPVMIKE